MNREENSIPAGSDLWYHAALRVAVVAAVFSAFVIALLVGNYLRAKTMDPLQPQRIDALQMELAKHPNDDGIKEQIRQLDYEIRREYFRSRHFAVQGGYLLFGGIILYLLAWEVSRRLRRQLPVPCADAGKAAWLAAARARHAVIAMGLIFGGFLVTVAMLSRHDATAEYAKAIGELPPETKHAEQAPANASPTANPAPTVTGAGSSLPVNRNISGKGLPAPSTTVKIVALPAYPKAWNENWPGFRGPNSNGIATVTDAPTSWNGATGQGIRWKTAVPLPGHNSPIVWGNRVFLSGATDKQRQVYCFDADAGALLWKADVHVPGAADEPPKVMEDTGFAAPTMTTDGERVFAIFADGDLAAFDFAGKPLWAKNLGAPESTYGYAASLVMAPTRLIVQFDQGSSPDDGKSVLYAFDPATGNIVWQAKRPVANSWSSPIIVHTAKGDQVITSGNPWVIASDPGSGSELWRVNCLSGDVAPTPTFANGMVFAVTANATLAAIRPDGRGDVTTTHVAWLATEGLPDTVSPLATGELVILSDSSGYATCYDAANGKKLWEHPFDTPYRASPTLVGNRIYMTDNQGVTHLLEAGRAFKEIGKCPLGEEVGASPAFVGGRIYLRGKDHLFCIGGK